MQFCHERPNGRINPAGVSSWRRKSGEPGRIVWMPAGDGKKRCEVKESNGPSSPSRNGELLPG
jgi:hypothetical protein